jgi:hypothetical protein
MLLAGCGQVVPGLTQRSGSLRTFDDPAGTLKAALAKAYGDLKTLTGRVTYLEVDPKDGKTRRSVASFKTDKAKRWIRALIEESDKPNAKGAETLFLNDGKITVRVKIGPFPVTKTFPIDDDQVTSARNYRIDQTDFAAMVGVVLADGAKVVSLGSGDLLGRKVDLLEVSPAGMADGSRERIGLDPVTHLPLARAVFGKAFAKPTGLFPLFTLDEPAEAVIFSAGLDGEKLDVDLPPGTWKF